MIASFRSRWPFAEHPEGGTNGDENPWDASEHITNLISRLGKNSDDDAVAAMQRLRKVADDGYTETIKFIFCRAGQDSGRSFILPPPHLTQSIAIARNNAPANTADLQVLMIEELDVAQAKIRSDDVDSCRGFYDDNNIPFDEERCRHYLLGLLRQGAVGIELNPETHVADDKRVDITCSAGELRLPIEIKGQWHRDLWHGADTQLDRLYTPDLARGWPWYLSSSVVR